ncbi:hypothetical protein VPH35_121186 [Triticum aestivum]
MDTKKRKCETLTYATAPSSSRRGEPDHVASPEEWRDWASLPHDVLYIILSRLRGAGLACPPWRRVAKVEPLLWRHIDLSPNPLRLSPPPTGWKAMARAAVERSDGRCESFSGHVDADVLVHLADRHVLLTYFHLARCIDAPLLRNLSVTGWPYIRDGKLVTEIIRKLPLLERLELWSGCFQKELLDALFDHCPRLELLDARECRPMFCDWVEPIKTRIRSCTIKDLRMPYLELH